MGKVRWNNWQQWPWTKKVVSRTATLLFNNACILRQKTSSRSFCCWLCVQIRVRLDSPLMNWTSTREYLEVSNVFVWYKANGSVCWISWELNLFMNVFITFVIRSWLLLLLYWLQPVINPHMKYYSIIVYILESKKVNNWRVKVFLSWNNHDLWSKCACVQIIWISIRIMRVWVGL